MKENVRDQLQSHLRRAAAAVLAIGAVAVGAAHADPSDAVVVPPTHLPAEYAVSGMPRARNPKLITAPGLTLPGLISDTGHCAFAVAGPAMDAPPAQDFGPIDTVLTYELTRLFDVKQVRPQMTRGDTGTSFTSMENGWE